MTSSNSVWDCSEASPSILLSQWAESIFSSWLVPRCSKSLAKLNQHSICGYRLRTPPYLGREQQKVSGSEKKLAKYLVMEQNHLWTVGKGIVCCGRPNSIYLGKKTRYQYLLLLLILNWALFGLRIRVSLQRSSFLAAWLQGPRPLAEAVPFLSAHPLAHGVLNHLPRFWDTITICMPSFWHILNSTCLWLLNQWYLSFGSCMLGRLLLCFFFFLLLFPLLLLQ